MLGAVRQGQGVSVGTNGGSGGPAVMELIFLMGGFWLIGVVIYIAFLILAPIIVLLASGILELARRLRRRISGR